MRMTAVTPRRPQGTTAAATAAPTTDSESSDGGGDEFTAVGITALDFEFEADVTTVEAESVIAVNFTNARSAPHTVNFYTDEEYSEAIPGRGVGQSLPVSPRTSRSRRQRPAPRFIGAKSTRRRCKAGSRR